VIRRLVALAVAALVAVPLVSSEPAAGRGEEPSGSRGIGDPYFPLDGNGGIDVLSYDVHDRYQFGDRRLSGWTRISLRPTETLSGFNLDFLLPVRSVRVGGHEVDFHQNVFHELRIKHPLVEDETINLVVKYAGKPGRYTYDGESNWLASDREVVAMNQPHMAPWWFPANDHPLDRADISVSITVPKGKQVIGNGHLRGRHVHGRLATTTWSADEPMVPYLAFFAAGSFEIAKGVDYGHEWYSAVSRRLPSSTRTHAMSLMKKSPEIVAWLEEALGVEYPFSATGGLTTSLSPGFALENQTRPTYERGSLSLATIVHELAHQWLGDSVAVEQWDDIWLNEGSATFMEAYYVEDHDGPSADTWLRNAYDSMGPGDSFWHHEVADPCPSHTDCVSSIFAGFVYDRGGMTLQALRNVIGEEDYWTLLRTWVTDREGGNGSTENFEALAEEVSGEDLADFFDVWLHTPAKPADTAANGLG
jgi:aminopeptidase N